MRTCVLATLLWSTLFAGCGTSSDQPGGSDESGGAGGEAPAAGGTDGHAGSGGKMPVGIPPGMTRLFDGTTLTGWDGNPMIWSVKDGAIDGKSDNGGQLIM